VFGEFCPHPKFAKHEKPNRTRPNISTKPRPSGAPSEACAHAGRTVAREIRERRPRRGAQSSLNLSRNANKLAAGSRPLLCSLAGKERIKRIVKPKHKASQMF